MDIIILGLMVVTLLVVAFFGISITSKLKEAGKETNQQLELIVKNSLETALSQNRQETLKFTQDYLNAFSQNITVLINASSTLSEDRSKALERNISSQLTTLTTRIETLLTQNQQQSESMRNTLEERLRLFSEDNSRSVLSLRNSMESLREQSITSSANTQKIVGEQLNEIRQTVDEKLQKTLNDRLSQSFELVTKQLEQVHKGLGEMQNLAVGVGDLKKVLSNVKTRGTLGEIQLEAILEQILAPEQYRKNVATIPDSRNLVEFAVVLPGTDDRGVLLPIDSKFPIEPYYRLLEAYETANADEVATAYKALENAIKLQAKNISEKYIEAPYTTDFAVMFLPVEGLYAEVVRHGLVETLQRDYKINIAGPTTMSAILNSLQMGFRTLAIQKRSSEVWTILSSVKSEFGKFGEVLEAARVKLRRANEDLDKLIGTRTNAILRRLKDVELLDDTQSFSLNIDSGEEL